MQSSCIVQSDVGSRARGFAHGTWVHPLETILRQEMTGQGARKEARMGPETRSASRGDACTGWARMNLIEPFLQQACMRKVLRVSPPTGEGLSA